MEEAHKGDGAGVDASIDLLWYDKAIAEDAARSGTSRMTGTGGTSSPAGWLRGPPPSVLPTLWNRSASVCFDCRSQGIRLSHPQG
ncbi:hypothetical protein M6B38_383860 [Iris pallida]|uniref:Uncharacterized protein n=1 Tax=Iris pallida TaxID=29817 RepID=A0AAX6G442_IRIPA|nr:hypothetical protein M6B38_383860 [Iris pallida]